VQQLFQYVDNKKSNKHRLYGFLAIASPIIAGFGANLYISIARADFWRSLNTADDADRMAGAMMGYAEGLEWIFWLGIGCIIGFILAVISIKLKQAVTVFNSLALAMNGLPLLLCAAGLIRGFLR
jgi:hypothetical protein